MKEKEYIFVLRTFDWNQILTVRVNTFQGRIQDFKLWGAHLKKLRRAEGENFWGISCEKSRFYTKKSYFFPIAEGDAKIFGVFRVKNHDFTPKNHIFSNFRGGRAGYAPLWIRPCICIYLPVQLRCQHNTFVYQSTNKFRP